MSSGSACGRRPAGNVRDGSASRRRRPRGSRGAALGAGLRVAGGVLVTGALVGVAACGGIADMTDAGEVGSFTVETPSLGAQTFEVDDEQVQCWAVPNGTSGAGVPLTLLDVFLQHDDDSWVRLIASSYGEDVVARASNRAGGCEEAAVLCCRREPCLDVTVRDDGVLGQYGHDDCWVAVTYSNGWAVGDFHCTFDPRTSTEPGTRVHGSFRCAIEEWTGHRHGFRGGPARAAPITDAAAPPRAPNRAR